MPYGYHIAFALAPSTPAMLLICFTRHRRITQDNIYFYNFIEWNLGNVYLKDKNNNFVFQLFVPAFCSIKMNTEFICDWAIQV